jgi:hypothetical protein
MTIVFVVFGFALLLPAAIRGGASAPPLPFAIGWLVVTVGWFGFNVVRAPYHVTIHPDGRVHFDRLLGRDDVRAADITRIRRFWIYSAIIDTRQGTIWLRVLLSEMFDFLDTLRQLNPRIEVEGL